MERSHIIQLKLWTHYKSYLTMLLLLLLGNMSSHSNLIFIAFCTKQESWIYLKYDWPKCAAVLIEGLPCLYFSGLVGGNFEVGSCFAALGQIWGQSANRSVNSCFACLGGLGGLQLCKPVQSRVQTGGKKVAGTKTANPPTSRPGHSLFGPNLLAPTLCTSKFEQLCKSPQSILQILVPWATRRKYWGVAV